MWSPATVTLTNLETGVTTVRVTEANGSFEFMTVRIGRYKAAAELQGFATAVADNIPVNVGARQRVDLALRPGQVNETVQVVGATQVLETDSSQRGQLISGRQAVELPLNGREYSALALLSPGVRLSALSTGSAVTSREGSFNVNGLRSTFNNFLLDGLDNNAYGTSNQGSRTRWSSPLQTRWQVQGRHQQHERGVRAERRRHHQRGVQERHEPVPRRGAGVLPRYGARMPPGSSSRPPGSRRSSGTSSAARLAARL